MSDLIYETLARLEREIAEDKIRTQESEAHLHELDFDVREAVKKLWNDHAARVAPMMAEREKIIKALATVRSFESPPAWPVRGADPWRARPRRFWYSIRRLWRAIRGRV